MTPLTREERLATFQQLTKLPGIKSGRAYADECANTVRLLIDHPHSYRSEVPYYSEFTLCLHESEFERVS